MKGSDGVDGGNEAAGFRGDKLGLRLTVGRTEMIFSSAAAGDFAGPQPRAVDTLEALSGITSDHWAQDDQPHGSRVNLVTTEDVIAPFSTPADGQVSDRDDLICAVRTADCLAVLIAGTKAFGAVHAGWRGLSEGVLAAAVTQIRELDDGPLVAAIGPGARGCCYEVDDDLRATFAEYPQAQEQPNTLDLAVIASEQLAELGIAEHYDCGICTICSRPQEYFSYRRDDGETGRMIGAVWLN